MKILYAGLEYDHYSEKRGKSFEHINFYESLKALPGVEVEYARFDEIPRVGKKQFNADLLDKAKVWKPDLFFAFMYTDELQEETLKNLQRHALTVAWFADDSWRFYNYTRIWAPLFHWAVTTYSWMPDMYRKIGQPNVIRSQWAANIHTYRPALSASDQFDTAFVGGWTNPRKKLVDEIESKGVRVSAFGGGWPGGRVSEERMIQIFSSAKINLGLNPAPGFFNKNSLGRLFFRSSIDKIVPDLHVYRNIRSWLNRGIPQIKARHFEIPACGGFVITSKADDLERFYHPGKEIVLYDNLADFIDKIRYYLDHATEREAIAKAGYERTLRDHTYEKRFGELFRDLGLGASK